METSDEGEGIAEKKEKESEEKGEETWKRN